MITIALRKRTLNPVRLVLKVTFFCCYMPQWCFFVFLGSIETGPEGPELEDYQVEKKSKAA